MNIEPITTTNLARTFADQLPDQLLIPIFDYLDLQDKASTPLDCREWLQKTSDEFLWKVVCVSRGIIEKPDDMTWEDKSVCLMTFDEALKMPKTNKWRITGFIDEVIKKYPNAISYDFNPQDPASSMHIPEDKAFLIGIDQNKRPFLRVRSAFLQKPYIRPVDHTLKPFPLTLHSDFRVSEFKADGNIITVLGNLMAGHIIGLIKGETLPTGSGLLVIDLPNQGQSEAEQADPPPSELTAASVAYAVKSMCLLF